MAARKGRRGPTSSRRGGRRGLAQGSPKIARSRQGGTVALSSRSGGIGQFARRGGGYRGFKSKKQWRWAYATGQPWAHKKAHETKGGKVVRYRRLPASKHSGHKGGPGPKGR
ncbi:hypothetical protein PBI_INDLOVU_75 [Mycobacterium phage Indlovu]|nr:hypothetical protein PBI_INDLOVU_75 [Mycobacterium phage Indlovu]